MIDDAVYHKHLVLLLPVHSSRSHRERIFPTKTKILLKYDIYSLDFSADQNPNPKSSALRECNPNSYPYQGQIFKAETPV